MNRVQVKNNNKIFDLIVRDAADESVVAEIFKHHEYRIADNILQSTNYPIIDIGAHAGYFSVYARSFRTNTKIIAIEPNADNIFVLKQNLELNKLQKIEVLEGAVGKTSGRRHLLIAKDSHNHKLLKDNKDKQKTIIVQTWSLSEIFKKCIIDRVGLVKMDIEGGEYEVFDGISDQIFEKINAFVIEYHNSSEEKYHVIEELLRNNGFGVQVFPSKFDKKMGFIFAQNKRVINK